MLSGLNHLASALGNKIEFNKEEYLYFGGTAYLGISQNENFLQFFLKGLEKFGLNNGTSRHNNIQLPIYDDAEQFCAQKFGSENSLISSSGYLAAQLTVKHFSNFGTVRYAPSTHPAIWFNEDPKVTGTFKDWAVDILEEINASSIQNWVVISNSMNNLFPEIYDFSFVDKLNKNVILIIDDSHGIGLNNNGLSALSSIPKLKNVEVIIVASMAKALGVDAGLVLGSAKIVEQLKQTSEYLGASPPNAAGLYAFMQATAIYEKERSRLLALTENLSVFLKDRSDWHFVPEFPVFLSKNAELSESLALEKILVSSFAYPDKDGPIINRIVLSSWHTDDDLAKLKKYL